MRRFAELLIAHCKLLILNNITIMKKILLIITLLLTSSVMADDWPQYRGPNRDGVSRETGLMKQWPEEGPPLVWTNAKLGHGVSSLAVVGDSI